MGNATDVTEHFCAQWSRGSADIAAVHQRSPERGPKAIGSSVHAKKAALAATISGEIIPRLLIMARPQEPGPVHEMAEFGLDAFGDLVCDAGPEPSLGHVQALIRAGTSVETIIVRLLVPTARRLGQEWEDDTRSFLDVTIGLCRIEQILREIGPRFKTEQTRNPVDLRVLLALAPGEQHRFGLMVVEEYLRREGYDVAVQFDGRAKDIVETVKAARFDVVGLSLGSKEGIPKLRKMIAQVRHASCNKKLKIMVGGPAFCDRGGKGESVDADVFAIDAADAVLQLGAWARAHGGVGLRST